MGLIWWLTTGVDIVGPESTTFKTTDGDDIIKGVVSSLTSDSTLNGGDKLDGGAGKNDTLKADVTLASFNGFTGEGFLKNVENVELTNSGTIGRSFDATGAAGVQKYVLNGDVSLSNLAASGITVNASAKKEGSLEIGFATAAVSGATDALTVGLTNVGTAATKDAAGATVAAKNVTVNATGIEALTVNATGDNYVNLAGATAAKTVTVAGEGKLNVSGVAATVTAFDASAAKGAITADLSAATAGTLTTVKGGAGDDKLTVANGSLKAGAVIDGGAGNNTLVLNGAQNTVLSTLSNIQTLELNAVAGGTVIQGSKAENLTAVNIKGGNTSAVTLDKLAAAAVTVTSTGAQAGSVLLTGAGELTYNTATTKTDKTAADAVTTNLTATEATKAVINVGAYTTQAGTFVLAKATDVALNVASGKNTAGDTELTEFTGKIDAIAAKTLTVKADGVLGGTINANVAESVNLTTGANSTITALNAAKAEQVTITAGGTLTAAGNLSGAKQIIVAANKGEVDLSAVTPLTNASAVALSGEAADSAVKLGALGSTTLASALTLTASGLQDGLTTGSITTGGTNVTLDVANVRGAVVVGGVTGAGNVTINAATLGSTVVTGGVSTVAGAAINVNASGLFGTAAPALNTGNLTVGLDGTAHSGSVNVVAGGQSNVVVGDISAKSVSLNLSELYGTYTGGAAAGITGQEITIKGQTVAVNNFGVATKGIKAVGANATLSLTGGTDTDTFLVNVDAATKSLTVAGDLISGTGDKVTIATANATGSVTVDVSGLKNAATDITLLAGAGTVKGSAGKDTIKIGKVTEGATLTVDGGAGSEDTLELGVGAATDLTLNKSKLVLSNVEKITVATASTVNAADISGQTLDVTGTAALTLKGTDLADTIDVSKFTGKVTVAGGKGNDTIKLGAAIDTVKFSAAADNGTDTITGFATGDILSFAAADYTGAKIVVASTAATTDANDLTVADIANTAKVAAFLSDVAAYTTSTAITDVVAITFGAQTGLYAVKGDATPGVVAGDITLVGTVDATLVGADIAIA